MSYFTPGPWKVQDEQLSPASEKRGFTIVTESFDVVSGFLAIRREADAQLISAAPDMYEVISELEESSSYWSEYDVPIGIVARILAALKKARGEA